MIIDNAILDLYQNNKAFFVHDCFNPDDVITLSEFYNHLNSRKTRMVKLGRWYYLGCR